MYLLKQPKLCPRCNQKAGAKILWGMPAMDEELEDAMSRGVLVLGGCVLRGDEADYQCQKCKHEWSGRKDMVVGEVSSVYHTIDLHDIESYSENTPSKKVFCEKLSGLCNKTWGELKTTDDEDKRYCNHCRKNVYKITTYQTLEKLRYSNKNMCVAYLKE